MVYSICWVDQEGKVGNWIRGIQSRIWGGDSASPPSDAYSVESDLSDGVDERVRRDYISNAFQGFRSGSRRNFLWNCVGAAFVLLPVGKKAAWAHIVRESAGSEESNSPGSVTMSIHQRYLNLPISTKESQELFQIASEGKPMLDFPLRLAVGDVEYWMYIDVSEYKGRSVTISGPASETRLARIYESDSIAGSADLYRETNRPQFHFSVKRGWSNDVNGPIFYKGQYHLFWQAYPFGVTPDVGFMYWGHAISSDMLRWEELSPALTLDELGSPWSGTALIDEHNDSGWGAGALVLVYTAFDRFSRKQVQCIAYSTDNAKSFTRFEGNPVVDSNRELGTFDTRDPKVFWYEPRRYWVMVLFEKDGMSFYSSTNLKTWTRKSHIKGFHECPDFFEMRIEGDSQRKKWVLHGGSSSYLIGSFDGDTFTPESEALRYAEGKNQNGDDVLYAAQSFSEMPDNRRVQIAWGRIEQKGMPFNQIMLFPTEFRLTNTADGLRLLANPIHEIEHLHAKAHVWSALRPLDANMKLASLRLDVIHLKAQVSIDASDSLTLMYGGVTLATFQHATAHSKPRVLEVLIDRSAAEVFIDGGQRYIIADLNLAKEPRVLEFSTTSTRSNIDRLEVYEMKSIWG